MALCEIVGSEGSLVIYLYVARLVYYIWDIFGMLH